MTDWEGFTDRAPIEENHSTTHAVFEGDDGQLSLDQRLCLIAMLKRPYITAAKQPDVWRTLMADEQLVKSRLNDLLLDLHVDRDRGVAYKVQVRSQDDRRFPPLLSAARFSREETLLLLLLRSRHRSERQSGEQRAYVDREEMLEHVARYRPEHATDTTEDRRRADRAVNRLGEMRLLLTTSGVVREQETRFEIAPVIDLLLPVEKVRHITSQIAAVRGPDDTDLPDTADQVDDESESP